MKPVRAKKHLGQHFLKDLDIANEIADALTGFGDYNLVLEIGPGMGVLTQFLGKKNYALKVIEIDRESVAYLKEAFKGLEIIEADFLNLNPSLIGTRFALIGNFPYNISSQILFKLLEWRALVPELVGMVQKEVGVRIASGPGNKNYGILSVLLQAFYKVEYLFTVPAHVFTPEPKVKSGVIRLQRNARESLPCSEKLFFSVVKQAFQMRRKTLRNTLKSFALPANMTIREIFDKRPEQLSVEQFIDLTTEIESLKN